MLGRLCSQPWSVYGWSNALFLNLKSVVYMRDELFDFVYVAFPPWSGDVTHDGDTGRVFQMELLCLIVSH